MRRHINRARVLALALALALVATACGGSGGGSGGGSTIKVAYQQFGEGKVMANFLAGVKKTFEKANPGKKVQLLPIVASENDYYTKLALMLRSPRTTPDLVYEDTFLINSDIKAGYLLPLDTYLKKWPAWSQFADTAKGAAKASDGKTYGVPDGTDTRGLWYNKKIFAKAGLPTTWQPKTWDDLLTAARAIKQKVPGVTPMNVYAGTGVGEAATMQGFEMLLYGTGDTLYDADSKKWVVGSQGFTDALTFLQKLKDEKLMPSSKDALEPTWSNTVPQKLLPEGKLAIALDGSWVSNNWLDSGAAPWKGWDKTMATTAMPTENGDGNGRVSLSGGWTWAIPKNSDNDKAAWDLIKMLGSKDRELEWAIKNVQIPVRKDVASDPSYAKANPTNKFFASLVPITDYRPAYSVYPRISKEIQSATESIVTGSSTPTDAAKQYDEQVKGIAGDDVTSASSQ